MHGVFGKSFKWSEQMCFWCVQMPVDYQVLAVDITKEIIGMIGTLWPQPSVKDIKILTDSESASVNKDRLVLVRKLLNEVKSETKCPSCLDHVTKAEEEVAWLEKTVPTIERVSRLRENLQSLLEEAKSELPLIEPSAASVPLTAESPEKTPSLPQTTVVPSFIKPSSGKSYTGQTSEGYCVECVEGHTMASITELRHAIDRYRTSGQMNEGVVEKVRVAIAELTGIDEDVKDVKAATSEVQEGLGKIVDKARWIRKEYGVGGRALTAGQGSLQDLEQLRNEVGNLQLESYQLLKKCPMCLKRVG